LEPSIRPGNQNQADRSRRRTGTQQIEETDRNTGENNQFQRAREASIRTNLLDMNRDQAPPKTQKMGRGRRLEQHRVGDKKKELNKIF
jgi:hypothetical protein